MRFRKLTPVALAACLAGCVIAPDPPPPTRHPSQTELRDELGFLLGHSGDLPGSVIVEDCQGEFLDDSSNGDNYQAACAATLTAEDFDGLFGRSPVSQKPITEPMQTFHGIRIGPAVLYTDIYRADWYAAEIYATRDKSRIVVYSRYLVEVLPKD